MIPAAMVVLAFAPMLETRTFLRLATAEMARAIATTDGDEALAFERIADMAANNAIDPARVQVSLCGGPESSLGGAPASTCLNVDGVLERGTYVTVSMSAAVDVVPIFTDTVTLDIGHEHAELIDLYRSIPQP